MALGYGREERGGGSDLGRRTNASGFFFQTRREPKPLSDSHQPSERAVEPLIQNLEADMGFQRGMSREEGEETSQVGRF